MQTEGGYRYPGTEIALVLGAVTLAAGIAVWVIKDLPCLKGLSLILSLEGTVLWASSLTPVGLVRPQGTIVQKFCWFFKQQGGTTLRLNQPMFYSGILIVLASILMAFYAG